MKIKRDQIKDLNTKYKNNKDIMKNEENKKEWEEFKEEYL